MTQVAGRLPNTTYAPKPVLRLTDKQRDQLHMLVRHRHALSVGGGRSGKTFGAVNFIVTRAMLAPGSRHLIFRKYARDAKQAVMQDTLPAVLKLWGRPEAGIAPPQVTVNLVDGVARIADPAGGADSEIWFAGLDSSNLDKILGREYATLYGNEASEYGFDVREVVLSRLAQSSTMRNGEPLPLVEMHDLNPTTTAHWTYKLFIEKVNPIDGEALPNPSDYGHTFMNPIDNAENLPPSVLEIYSNMSEANRRRFLLGQYTAEAESGLWRRSMIRHHEQPAVMDKVCVAIDPAVSTKPGCDETGVIGAGLHGPAGNRVITILEDASGRYQPLQWANVAIEMAGRIGATVIVCERNQGGDMVAQTLRSAGWTGRIEEVTATKGKATRAEPIAALYERGLVRHAYVMPKLEEQLCSMTADFDSASAGWSPDRADALVWACTFLHPPVTAPGRPVTKPAARPKHRW